MNYVKLAEEIYQTAKDKGWWEDERPTDRIFALIASELYEAMEADREGKRANYKSYNKSLSGMANFLNDLTEKDFDNEDAIKAFKSAFELNIKDTLEDELADALIRCLDYLFYLHKECFSIADYSNYRFKEDFASNIFYINKILCDYDLNEAAGAIIGLAEHMEIDLEWHVKQKMKYNDLRSYKHGGKKY